VEVDGQDAHELVERINWGGAKGTSHVADCFILRGAEFAEEGFLTRVPYWGCVGEDREDDRVVDYTPLGPG